MRIIIGFLLAALLLAAAGWLVTGPLQQYPVGFDSAVRGGVRAMMSPTWTSLFLAVTKLGSTLYLTIFGVAAGAVFIALRWFRPLLLLIVAMAGAGALHHGFQWLIAWPRPRALIAYPTSRASPSRGPRALRLLPFPSRSRGLPPHVSKTPPLKGGILAL